jgi:hypothetical protein
MTEIYPQNGTSATARVNTYRQTLARSLNGYALRDASRSTARR